MYNNKEICSKCGGKCCKNMPGCCYPSDFDLPGDFTKLNTALASGKYTIDCWEGDIGEVGNEYKQGFFVRPAIKGKLNKRHDYSWYGKCNFLSKNGCTLEPDKRPLNCRLLEPVEHGQCKVHNDVGRQDSAIAWLPYYNKLKE